MISNSAKLFRHAIPVLLGLLLVTRLIGMAAAPLMDTTEARYGEISRKMAELNDWVTPWFDYGVPYWGKPPLSFWITAIGFKLFGVNEFSARLPHLLIAVAIVGLIGWLSARRDRDAVIPAVACLSGSFLYFIAAGAVMTDIELVLGTSLSMAGFWLALEGAGQRGSSRMYLRHAGWRAGTLFFGGLVIGLLAKGPVALVLTGAPLFIWTTYQRRWFEVWRRLPWISGALLTLVIAMPWYVIAEQHTNGFLQYFLMGEHWHRFVTAGWNGDRYGNAHVFPVGTIWLFAVVDMMPWSFLLPFAAWHWRNGNKAPTLAASNSNGVIASFEPSESGSDDRAWHRYLLIWAFVPLLFFTAARNIIMTYALPGMPAAALLAGGWLAREHRRGHDINRWLCGGLLLTLLVMIGVAIVDLSIPDKMEHKSVKTMVAAYEHAIGQEITSHSSGTRPTHLPLIFIWSRPFSAQFYSHGEAVKVANDEEAWRRIGDGAAYVATRSGNAFIASASAPHGNGTAPTEVDQGQTKYVRTRTVTQVGHYGDFDLFFVAER